MYVTCSVFQHLPLSPENQRRKGHFVPSNIKTVSGLSFLPLAGALSCPGPITFLFTAMQTEVQQGTEAHAVMIQSFSTSRKKWQHNKEPLSHLPTDLHRQPMRNTNGEEIPWALGLGVPTTHPWLWEFQLYIPETKVGSRGSLGPVPNSLPWDMQCCRKSQRKVGQVHLIPWSRQANEEL